MHLRQLCTEVTYVGTFVSGNLFFHFLTTHVNLDTKGGCVLAWSLESSSLHEASSCV